MINYYLITKPGIITGNLITVVAGFLLASKNSFDPWLLAITLLGLSCVMASGCVLNNLIDGPLDRKMKRTMNRPLVQGVISEKKALSYALALLFAGGTLLMFGTNLLTFFVASVGFFVYVILYSFWKSKTIYGTAIGSIAGAVPPVVGYCAVSNNFDLTALLLFLMLVMWQMAHFIAIAIYHLEDYTAAGLPLLPIEKGVERAKIHMLLYIVGFIAMIAAMAFFHLSSTTSLLLSLLLSVLWFFGCLQGFRCANDKEWGKKMFRYSLIIIVTISLILPF